LALEQPLTLYNKSMTFSEFAQKTLQPLDQTPSKLAQTQILAAFFHEVSAAEVKPYLYLCLGQLGPIFHNPQTNVGSALVLQALSELEGGAGQSLFGDTQVDPELARALKKRYKKIGDLGLLTQEVLTARQEFLNGSSQTLNHITTQPDLSVPEVFAKILEIAQACGEGSQEQKVHLLAELLKQLNPLSAKYVVRIVLANLRLGFSDKTVLDALSWYLTGDKSQREALEDVYQRHPDIGEIAQKVLAGGPTQGVQLAQKIDVQLGVPVIPALADRLRSAKEMIEKMGEVYVEPKYDGTRVQIHWNAQTQELHTFTRNLEENSHMFPELKRLLQDVQADNLILDSEAVGYNPSTSQLVTFQQTIKRKRKHDIEMTMESIPLRFFVFDVLYLDGQPLLKEPLEQRKAKLQAVFSTVQGSDLVFAPSIRTQDPDELSQFHAQQLAQGYEGVLVKQAQSHYEAGRKAFSWVKLKEAEGTRSKLSDTIDAVVIGYYLGKGKRTQFGVGAFLIAILDQNTDHLVTIAKVGTGLTDEQWQELKSRADAIQAKHGDAVSSQHPIEIPDNLQPDVMLSPDLVVEVAADEITQSPTHTAGLALRFPRLVNFRDDKSVDQITTVEEMKKIKIA